MRRRRIIMFYRFDEAIMTDPAKTPEANTPEANTPSQTEKEPHSPDDLVHMYGSTLLIAVPLILIALIVYFLFIR